jgi:hypothetical protein
MQINKTMRVFMNQLDLEVKNIPLIFILLTKKSPTHNNGVRPF